MSSHAVACPHCHVPLRANRPLSADRSVRCPYCGTFFSTAPLGQPRRGPQALVLFGVAVTVALLLAGGIIALALLLGRDRGAPRDDGQERLTLRLAEEKKKLDEERAQLDEEKRRLEL